MKKFFVLVSIFIAVSNASFAKVPFNKGVNLTNWFQAGNIRQVQFTKYTKKDFVNIKSLGCDVIRLPINLHYMTTGAPDYTVDPLFFEFMDQAVAWAEELQLYLILDNHTFDPIANTDPNIAVPITKIWQQVAEHYKGRSNYILYEILNEPHGISAQAWGQAQQAAIDAIRTVDTKHTIIVGGVNYNSYNDLQSIPVYTDQNLIYTFHFYDPFMFTHQGASWVSPSMVPLAGVPFPYDPSRMPACPPSLKGSWVESALNNYNNDGTLAKVRSLIDIAVAFKNSRNVDVFCGEFGVYIANSNNTDRVYWYSMVRQYLEQKGIPWTTWDFQGGFGLFKKNSNEFFDHDLDTELLQSLGFNVPPQTPYIPKPEAVGFRIYSDYVEINILQSNYGSGIVDFYSNNFPNNDKYCLDWKNAAQYNYIAFDFVPDKDMSGLVANNYALDLIVRGTMSASEFVVRFVDTKKDSVDHPWRMDFPINNSKVAFDGRWHHLRIPLKDFVDMGAWDNNTWYTSKNLFDWKEVDGFSIVAEQGSLLNKQLWFDNIQVSDRDTASIRQNVVVAVNSISKPGLKLSIYPNPMNVKTTINYEFAVFANVEIAIYNLSGLKVRNLVNKRQAAGSYSINWDRRDEKGNKVATGIYICQLNTGSALVTQKLVTI